MPFFQLVKQKFVTFVKFCTLQHYLWMLFITYWGVKNLDNFAMELEDSFQCFDFCRSDLLKTVQEEKKEILFFEDRKDDSSSIIIIVTKQLKTKSKREHVIFNAVVRLTIMVEPKVGYARYFKFTGQLISLNIQFPIKYFVTY